VLCDLCSRIAALCYNIPIMKKITVLLIVALLFGCLAPAAQADMSVGYETLVILPHAFTLNYHSEETGWGYKAAADFGLSVVSVTTLIFTHIFTLGLIERVSFVGLSLTKDVGKGDNTRDYVSAGGLLLIAEGGGQAASAFIPSVGWGREWQKVWNTDWSTNLEISFPEMMTFGMRYHF
jgi:hypothetical protein